jgi:hypothetical protein
MVTMKCNGDKDGKAKRLDDGQEVRLSQDGWQRRGQEGKEANCD